MKDKKFWWAVAAIWFVLFVTDWLFHGMWLNNLYESTPELWRAKGTMLMQWIWVGNFVFAWAFVWMFTKGISKDSPWHQAFRYGCAVMFVGKFPSIMTQWATVPYSTELVWKWVIVNLVQILLCAFAVAWFWRKEIGWSPSGAHAN